MTIATVETEAPSDPRIGTFTLVNPRTGGYRTIRLSGPSDFFTDLPAGTLVASYLNGPDNENNFKGFAFVKNGQALIWKSARHLTDKVAALTCLLRRIDRPSDRAELGRAYALRSGNCWVCGRTLTTPESLADGIGPVCAARLAA